MNQLYAIMKHTKQLTTTGIVCVCPCVSDLWGRVILLVRD